MNSGNKNDKFSITDNELKSLKKIIKIYSNFYKALYMFDPSLSSEFKNKNEFFMNESSKRKNKYHVHSDSSNNCCSGKLNNKSTKI